MNIDEIKERLAKAGRYVMDTNNGQIEITIAEPSAEGAYNFIAHAPADIKALIEAVEASSALREFARQVIKEQCWGCEMDGFEIQDLAEKLELIAKHTATEDDVDDEDDYEAGDTIYKFTEILKGSE